MRFNNRNVTRLELIKCGKEARKLAHNRFQQQLEEGRKECKRRKSAA